MVSQHQSPEQLPLSKDKEPSKEEREYAHSRAAKLSTDIHEGMRWSGSIIEKLQNNASSWNEAVRGVAVGVIDKSLFDAA